jgi:hypothetical protein
MTASTMRGSASTTRCSTWCSSRALAVRFVPATARGLTQHTPFSTPRALQVCPTLAWPTGPVLAMAKGDDLGARRAGWPGLASAQVPTYEGICSAR